VWSASLEHRLRQGAVEIGVDLAQDAVERFSRYADLLARWNRRIDLTTLDDPEAIIDRHFLDSLAIVPHLPAAARTLVDVGSGAGFPGLPIALVRPDLAITLVEPRHKRAAFLRAALAETGCAAAVQGARAEDLAGHSTWDVAVSRATLPPSEWVALGRRLARHVAAWVARPTDLPAVRRISYRLPDGFRGVIELFDA
jgi:16S rRNA (guanine527-N7)-methyltransferase